MCPVIDVMCCMSLARLGESSFIHRRLGEQSVAQLTDFRCPANGMVTRVQYFELECS